MQIIKQHVQSIEDQIARHGTLRAFHALHSSQVLSSLGLNFAAAGTTGRTSTSVLGWVLVNGVLVKVSTSTALPALTGVSVPAGQKAIAGFHIDAAGAFSITASDANASLSNLRIPATSDPSKVTVGYLVIENGSGGAFTGGTTALDAASITSSFISVTGTPGATLL